MDDDTKPKNYEADFLPVNPPRPQGWFPKGLKKLSVPEAPARRLSSQEMYNAIDQGVKREIDRYRKLLPSHIFEEHATSEKSLVDLYSLEKNTSHTLPPDA
jgi:hypothetical protein